MRESIEQTETWRWVQNHFRRMGWTVELRDIIIPPGCKHLDMVSVNVIEPRSGAMAFMPTPVADFERPANKMAPFMIQTLCAAYGESHKEERKLANAVRAAARAFGVSTKVYLGIMAEQIEKRREREG